MNGSPRVIVRGKRRVFDGFFKLDEVTVSHRQFDGTMSTEKPLLIFERGDAVGALLLNRDSGEVVLVEQFRVPTLEKGRNKGWMIEAPAGMIRGSESPEQAVVREVLEETGYRIQSPEHIATFFSSPGGTSERIFLFYAVVEDADRTGPGVGNRADGEDIRVVTMTVEDLFEQLRQAAVEDPKLIIAAYHLKDRIKMDRERPQVLRSETFKFAMKSNPQFVIGIKTGEILKVEDVDVWVNSENTDMMMDRIIDPSISGTFVTAGRRKTPTARFGSIRLREICVASSVDVSTWASELSWTRSRGRSPCRLPTSNRSSTWPPSTASAPAKACVPTRRPSQCVSPMCWSTFMSRTKAPRSFPDGSANHPDRFWCRCSAPARAV